MWIIARTAAGRPTLMHQLEDDYGDRSSCGLDVTLWSRAYRTYPIREIACMKCSKKAGR